jgi:hypothetical protein
MSAQRDGSGTNAGDRDSEAVSEDFYSDIPEDIDAEEFREHLPFWVTTRTTDRASSARGSERLHFPEEGSTKHDPEKLCGTAISDKSELVGKDIPVYPRGNREKCTRCQRIARRRASE